MECYRDDNGKLASYAWPGGYEVHYITKDCTILCHNCANGENGSRAAEILDPECPDDDQWRIIACDVHWEEDKDSELHCDHCNRRIEPEYGVIGED